MAFKVIDLESVDTRTLREKYPIPDQKGPLSFHEREMRCARRGCGSSTFFKVNNIPTCMKHALFDLNDIICGLTGEGRGLDADGTERRDQRELECAAP